MSAKILVPIADGSEEIEAVTIIDTLRRAGVSVTVASVNGLTIKASRGVVITADALIAECKDTAWDVVALPGGMPGAEHLRDSPDLTAILKVQAAANRPYAAICASPAVVLDPLGLLKGKRATCSPSYRLTNAIFSEDRVVVDGNCVTSRGPGTALEFALALVEVLFGKAKSEQLAREMLLKV